MRSRAIRETLCYAHGCMSALVLDGRKISAEIRSELRSRVEFLTLKYRSPGLAVILVGEDPASEIYVRNKVKACQELGIRSFKSTPNSSICTDELLSLVEGYNRDPEVDGILVQMPLPKHVNSQRVLLAVDPSKDADGFHPFNVGNLVGNRPGPRSCTPAGIIELLKRYEIPLSGSRAVIVGRSDIVGKPMAMMLLHENATVTICHSRTRDLAEECRRADILVAAMGKPAMLTASYIRDGAVVVDVGMNRLTRSDEVQRLFAHEPSRLEAFAKTGSLTVGDVEPFAMQTKASAYTPVPGGVGPLTIAMLMSNTVALAEQHLGG
ncbi:MAG: bifunctional methylenetetrahydrofolate dehydrogenase/methenyltetrahydrofolate cyclohydrolase FolD [Bryobacteraceae bacterium]